MSNGTAQSVGQQAVNVAVNQIGKPYKYGGQGPDNFDCAGLLRYSYLNGPHIDIGGGTSGQWSSSNMTTVFDAAAAQAAYQQAGGGSLPVFSGSDLQPGDCIYYFADSNSGAEAHCMMFVAPGSCIQAPYTGQDVGFTALPLDQSGNLTDLSTSDPLRGVRRAKSSAAGTSGSGSGSNSSGSTSGGTTTDWASAGAFLKNAKDPRNNLPFSLAFQGQAGVKSAGSLVVPATLGRSTLYPTSNLVRGGMGELAAKQFRFYFMMNPQTISITAQVDTSMLSPFQTDPSTVGKFGSYPVSNQSVSFTVYFNRMYEVWQGNINGPDGSPGPSGEGVRWDTRALERLMGILDATTQDEGGPSNQWGSLPAQMLPLKVVFGMQNALQFTGFMTQFDYTFTIFDGNMIPVEGYADITVMRIYIPGMDQADVFGQSLATQTQRAGPQKMVPSTTNVNVAPFTAGGAAPFGP